MHFENKLAMASKLIKINQLSYGRHLDRGHGHCEPSVHSGHRNDMSTVDQSGSGHDMGTDAPGLVKLFIYRKKQFDNRDALLFMRGKN